MSVAAKTREDTASVTRERQYLGGHRGTCVSKNFDETERLQSEKSGCERTDYMGLHRARAALSVWQSHQLRCSLREMSVRGTIET